MNPYKFPTPMQKTYRGPRGSHDWVAGMSRSIQLTVQVMTLNDVRMIREDMEKIRNENGWNVWPDPPARTPRRWIEIVLGQTAEDFLAAVKVFSPEEAQRLSWIAKEDREVGAKNIDPRGAAREGGGKRPGDTRALKDDKSVSGLQRRLQRRADSGDEQAANLLVQIDAGAISTNKAAELAGMRTKYFRIPSDDPRRAAERIIEKLGPGFADELLVALTRINQSTVSQ